MTGKKGSKNEKEGLQDGSQTVGGTVKDTKIF